MADAILARRPLARPPDRMPHRWVSVRLHRGQVRVSYWLAPGQRVVLPPSVLGLEQGELGAWVRALEGQTSCLVRPADPAGLRKAVVY